MSKGHGDAFIEIGIIRRRCPDHVVGADARTVTAYQANQPPAVFAATDTLTALPVIPGFAVLVGDLLPA